MWIVRRSKYEYTKQLLSESKRVNIRLRDQIKELEIEMDKAKNEVILVRARLNSALRRLTPEQRESILEEEPPQEDVRTLHLVGNFC